MKTLKSVQIILLFGWISLTFCQNSLIRSRGENWFQCESANTIGSGNLWVRLRTLGFIWDSDPEKDNAPSPFAFPEIKAEIGVQDFASVYLESRFLTYGWKFGWFASGIKYTFLDNKDIRLHNLGIKIEYQHRFLSNFSSSIAGYHNSEGTGFCPEGFIIRGGNATVLALYDLDLLAKFSWLPLKISTNIGVKFPFSKTYLDYSRYLINCCIAFVGVGADVFVEYSLAGFARKSTTPKIFNYYWPGWYNEEKKSKVWEVAFSENPMYISLGGRVRYTNGFVITGVVPLLLSQNAGSAMTDADRSGLKHGKFPEETKRGITDPFDPWYPKWKIILQASYPIRYRLTSAEMRRNFLLLKNKKTKKRIDIDKRIIRQEEEAQEDDRKRRLEEIKKRREEIEQSE